MRKRLIRLFNFWSAERSNIARTSGEFFTSHCGKGSYFQNFYSEFFFWRVSVEKKNGLFSVIFLIFVRSLGLEKILFWNFSFAWNLINKKFFLNSWEKQNQQHSFWDRVSDPVDLSLECPAEVRVGPVLVQTHRPCINIFFPS